MLVKTRQLRPGMVLGRDLYDSGTILLREGAVLTDMLISVLKHRGIKHVDIMENNAAAMVKPKIQSIRSLAVEGDEEYRTKRAEMDELFAEIDDEDSQMQMLKYCLYCQLEENSSEAGEPR